MGAVAAIASKQAGSKFLESKLAQANAHLVRCVALDFNF